MSYTVVRWLASGWRGGWAHMLCTCCEFLFAEMNVFTYAQVCTNERNCVYTNEMHTNAYNPYHIRFQIKLFVNLPTVGFIFRF